VSHPRRGSNLAAMFADARRLASGDHPQSLGQKHVVILTRETLGPDLLAGTKKWLGPECRDIAVVSYTKLEALMDEDHGKIKCIPVYAEVVYPRRCWTQRGCIRGPSVGVGVWSSRYRRPDNRFRHATVPPGRLDERGRPRDAPRRKDFVCGREQQNLLEVRPASQPPGWIYKQPDGEASYAYCLLTVLGKRSGSSAALTTGGTVPNLKALTDNPDDLEWVAGLPFDYNRLDAGLVIKTILKTAGVSKDGPRLIPGLKIRYALNARLAEKGGTAYCPFQLTVSGFGSRRRLEILRGEF